MRIGDIVRVDAYQLQNNGNLHLNKDLLIIGYIENDLAEEILLVYVSEELKSYGMHKSRVYVYKSIEQQRMEKLEKLNGL